MEASAGFRLEDDPEQNPIQEAVVRVFNRIVDSTNPGLEPAQVFMGRMLLLPPQVLLYPLSPSLLPSATQVHLVAKHLHYEATLMISHIQALWSNIRMSCCHLQLVITWLPLYSQGLIQIFGILGPIQAGSNSCSSLTMAFPGVLIYTAVPAPSPDSQTQCLPLPGTHTCPVAQFVSCKLNQI